MMPEHIQDIYMEVLTHDQYLIYRLNNKILAKIQLT